MLQESKAQSHQERQQLKWEDNRLSRPSQKIRNSSLPELLNSQENPEVTKVNRSNKTSWQQIAQIIQILMHQSSLLNQLQKLRNNRILAVSSNP